MKRMMWITCALTGAGSLLFAQLELQALAITCGTFFYHMAMRLAVGYVLLLVPRRFDADSMWFAEKKWEKKLYAQLRVREWKHKVPSFNPQDFDLRKNAVQEIIQTMCVSELVHEIIVVLSFVPLLFALCVGEFWVFALTSATAAGVDMVFVVLQRFNRPRLVKLAKRERAAVKSVLSA